MHFNLWRGNLRTGSGTSSHTVYADGFKEVITRHGIMSPSSVRLQPRWLAADRALRLRRRRPGFWPTTSTVRIKRTCEIPKKEDEMKRRSVFQSALPLRGANVALLDSVLRSRISIRTPLAGSERNILWQKNFSVNMGYLAFPFDKASSLHSLSRQAVSPRTPLVGHVRPPFAPRPHSAKKPSAS